ncbi:MAG: hypothetical protein JO033_00150 [Acidobacteriaceae bacterium]|nr:hypothetical protein [Acidobacteriaceae bacterium]MBV9503125.1 hypothetical protein [Acidobacteriaceae bacterium]
MKKIYQRFLRLYPTDYATFFATEMLSAFEQLAEKRRARGKAALLRFALREFASVAVGAGTEWISKLTTDRAIRGRCLPDIRMMRPVGVPREVWFRAPSSRK